MQRLAPDQPSVKHHCYVSWLMRSREVVCSQLQEQTVCVWQWCGGRLVMEERPETRV